MGTTSEAMPIITNDWELPYPEKLPEVDPEQEELPFIDELALMAYDERLALADDMHDKLSASQISGEAFDDFMRLALPEHYSEAA